MRRFVTMPGACAERYCTLHDMADVVHLWSMVSDGAPAMLRHFLVHYARAGVRLSSHAAFLVHTPPNATTSNNEALRILADQGVRSVEVVNNYHSNLKRSRVNAHIKSLPLDAWLIYADVDELVSLRFEPRTLRPARSLSLVAV